MKTNFYGIAALLIILSSAVRANTNNDSVFSIPADNSVEGGEIVLIGAAGFPSWHMDAIYHKLRFYTEKDQSSITPLSIDSYTGEIAITHSLKFSEPNNINGVSLSYQDGPSGSIYETADRWGLNHYWRISSPEGLKNIASLTGGWSVGQSTSNVSFSLYEINSGMETILMRSKGTSYFNGGNIGFGTMNPTHLVTVNGTLRAKEIIVDNTGWADYVFDDNYLLQSLEAVEQHIKEKKHLPGIPSAKDVSTQGLNLGEMQSLLLAKIEELTLHQIAQEKRLNALECENAAHKALLKK